MGSSSSSAKPAKQPTNQQSPNPQPTVNTDAPNKTQTGEQQGDTMSRTDPNKSNQQAQDPTKQDSERKGPVRRDYHQDDNDDGYREHQSGKNKTNERSSGSRRDQSDERNRGDRRHQSDDRDSDGYDNDRGHRGKQRDSAHRSNSRENRQKLTPREQDDSHANKTDDDREGYLHTLEKIAKELFEKPPDPVNDSKTYTSAVETYDNRLRAARNERELQSLYDREEKLLQNQTAEDHLRAKHAKYNDVTRQTQQSEYRLKLSALINCFKEKNKYYELLTLQRQKEKREDVSFLMTLKEQIEMNDLSRADVLRQMDEYISYYKGHRQENGGDDRGPTSSSDRYQHNHQNQVVEDSSTKYATKPSPGQGVPPPSEPPYRGGGSGYPLPAGAKLRVKDEAARVMADSERNTQRAVDVRKADRSRINRELDSRASSVNTSSIPPR